MRVVSVIPVDFERKVIDESLFVGYLVYRRATDDFLYRVARPSAGVVASAWCRNPGDARLFAWRFARRVAKELSGDVVELYDSGDRFWVVFEGVAARSLSRAQSGEAHP